MGGVGVRGLAFRALNVHMTCSARAAKQSRRRAHSGCTDVRVPTAQLYGSDLETCRPYSKGPMLCIASLETHP